jgi:hypothetical protein
VDVSRTSPGFGIMWFGERWIPSEFRIGRIPVPSMVPSGLKANHFFITTVFRVSDSNPPRI